MVNHASIATGVGDKIKEYGVSLAIAAYIAGFVVTSIYLGQYNVANFDIIRARYVLIGTMFLMFAFTCLFPAYISWRELIQEFTRKLTKVGEKRKVAPQRVFGVLFKSLVGNVFAVAAIGLPLYIIISLTTGSELPIVFSYLSTVIFLLNSVFVLLAYGFIALLLSSETIQSILSQKEGQDSNPTDGDMYFQLFFTPSIAILLLFVIVFAYSFFVFPALPQALGGGKPISVEVTYKSPGPKQILDILDRSSATTIFLTEDCLDHTKRAMEVANDEILGLSPVQPGVQCP